MTQCTLTVDGPCRRTLRFEIARARVEQEVETGLGQIAPQVQVKGFRPGKVPSDVVRRMHGKQIRQEVEQRLIQQAFVDGLKEHELQPLGQPELNLAAIQEDENAPFTFEVSVEVEPPFELAALEDIPVTVQVPEVDDAAVESVIEHLQRQEGQLADAEEGVPIERADLLHASVVYEVDGMELDARDERPILPERDIMDEMRVEGSGEAFAGRKKGDRVDLPVELPGHFEPTMHAGKSAMARITITGHRHLVPSELDAAFLEKHGCEDRDALAARIREQLEARNVRWRDEQIDQAVEGHLVEAHPIELPERMLARAIDERIHRLAHQLIEQQGVSSDQGHQMAEQERPQISEAVRRSLVSSLILSRIAREQNLAATAEEAEAQIRSLAQSQGDDVEKVLEASRTEGWFGDVAAQLTEAKARDWLRGKTVVTETEPTQESPAEGTPE